MTRYATLKGLCNEAWQVIVTAFEPALSKADEGAVTWDVTGVTFTEFLLHDVLDLHADQQRELVQALASGQIRNGGEKKVGHWPEHGVHILDDGLKSGSNSGQR